MQLLLPVSCKGELNPVKYILCIYDNDNNNNNYYYLYYYNYINNDKNKYSFLKK